MIRISLAYPYQIGLCFSRLRADLAVGKTLSEARYPLADAEQQLAGLFHPDALYTRALRGAQHDADELYVAIKKLTTDADQTRKIDFIDQYSVYTALDKFETILTAELRAADAYFVSKKGGYDTIDLISNAVVLFPSDLAAKVPEAVNDVQEAGKCIAFELGTAAGFHLLRANEVVLLKYFDTTVGSNKRPTNRNMGALLKRMEDLNLGDKKVLATLTQIKDLHRNTLMHPEDVLTIDQAIDLLSIIRSAVSAMLERMPSATPQPTAKKPRKKREQSSRNASAE